MAKGQVRGNKETKKPKKPKQVAVPMSSIIPPSKAAKPTKPQHCLLWASVKTPPSRWRFHIWNSMPHQVSCWVFQTPSNGDNSPLMVIPLHERI